MKLLELLNKIEEQQSLINASGKLSADVLKKINYKFRLDWNYYSNRMEGGTLTMQETRSVMVGNIAVENKPFRDVAEMRGHDKIVLEILKIGKGELRISEKRIQEIHKAIMVEDDTEKQKEIGKWKSKPNEIIGYKDEKIAFTPPGEVAEKMHQLLDKTNAELDKTLKEKKEAKHPVLLASDFHIDYVSIHPFYDGNGRTSRILTNLILIACGLPVIVIKDEDKKRYYQLLGDIQAYRGNRDLFTEFIAERVIASQQLILDAINGKDIGEEDDLDKRIKLLKTSLQTDDKINTGKNTENVYSVLSKIAFPLFKEAEEKSRTLNELFMDFDKELLYQNNHSSQMFRVGSKESIWEVTKINWLDTEFRQQNIDVQNIKFKYSLIGFKKSIHGQSCSSLIEFEFRQFNYSIIINNYNNEEIKKTYSEVLTVKEKKQLVDKFVGSLIDDIERHKD